MNAFKNQLSLNRGASKNQFPIKNLIYRGRGACASCSSSAGQILEQLGQPYRYVGPESISAERLKQARMWIQPGGNALDVVKVINDQKLALFRDFVKNGGTYLGICAGAFFCGYDY